MPKQPAEAEFIWQSEHRLKHQPTGVWWAVYKSSWPANGILSTRQRAPEGSDYLLDDLDRMAETVIKKRFPQ